MKGLLLFTLLCIVKLPEKSFAREETYTACGFASCELKVHLNKVLSEQRSHIVIEWDQPKPLAYLNAPYLKTQLLTYKMQYKIPSPYGENWHDVEGCEALHEPSCDFHLRVFHATYNFRVRVFNKHCEVNCTSRELSIDPTSLVLMPPPDFELRQVDDRLIVRHHSAPPGVQSLGQAHELYYQIQQNASLHRYPAGNSEMDLPIQNYSISSDEMLKCCVRLRVHIPSMGDFTLANSQWSEWRCIDTKSPRSDGSHSVAWVVLGLTIGFVTSAIGGFMLYRIYTACRQFYKRFQKIPETLELVLDDEDDAGLTTTRGEPMAHESYEIVPLSSCDTTNTMKQHLISNEWIRPDSPAPLVDIKALSRSVEFPRSSDPAYVTMTSVIAGLTSPGSLSDGSVQEYPTNSLSSPDDWLAVNRFFSSSVNSPTACVSCNHRKDHIPGQKYAPLHDCTSQADSGLSFMHSTSSGASSSTEPLLQCDSLQQQCFDPSAFSTLQPSNCATHSPQVKRHKECLCIGDDCACACHSSSETRLFCTPNFSYVSSEMATLGFAMK